MINNTGAEKYSAPDTILIRLEIDIMKYMHNNRIELDQKSLHDACFEGFVYDYLGKSIKLACTERFGKKRINLTFNNVIFSELQSYELWGMGISRIYDIWYEDNSEQMNYLQSIINLEQEKSGQKYVFERDKYLQIKIQIISGDVFYVICESLDWLEENIKD